MRAVILDPRHPGWGGAHPDERIRRRLSGHLAARLREYTGFGIEDVADDDGVVSARIGVRSGRETARLLAERGVFCQWNEDRVMFFVGSHTCFEELDWVQAAASELLE